MLLGAGRRPFSAQNARKSIQVWVDAFVSTLFTLICNEHLGALLAPHIIFITILLNFNLNHIDLSRSSVIPLPCSNFALLMLVFEY